MLRELLRPDWVLGATVVELPVAQLQERDIRALVLDVDRTLLPRRQGHLPERAELWLQQARAQLPIHLLSNNPSRRRIGSVADHMQLPFTTSAGKPRRTALRRVVQDLGLPMEQVALVGDRLFTDVLAGNRLGLFTVLVKPIDASGQPCQRDRLQTMELRVANWVGTRLN